MGLNNPKINTKPPFGGTRSKMAIDLRKAGDLEIFNKMARKAKMDGVYLKAQEQKWRIEALIRDLKARESEDEEQAETVALQQAEAEALLDFCNTTIREVTKILNSLEEA